MSAPVIDEFLQPFKPGSDPVAVLDPIVEAALKNHRAPTTR
ncbi:MAG TPA: hypothetical protein VGO30_03745 [Mycobacterium sp.]|jgi:hypothetical protein|nr:hypothetical protein [Mycobacterium sp.]